MRNLQSVLLQKCIEFRNKLTKVAESKEAPVDRPWRTCDSRSSGSRRCYAVIAFSAKENNALSHSFLPWDGLSIDVFDSWLRKSVVETKTGVLLAIGRWCQYRICHLLLVAVLLPRSGMASKLSDLDQPCIFLATMEDTLYLVNFLVKYLFRIRSHQNHNMDFLFEMFVPVCKVVSKVVNVRKHALLEDIVPNIIFDAKLDENVR